MPELSPVVLSARHVCVDYDLPRWIPWKKATKIRAVNDIHFDLRRGETLGLVGESGCGKSTLARALLGLNPISYGQVMLDGHNLASLNKKGWRDMHQAIQLIFQDPLASLNPRMTIGEAIAEPLRNMRPDISDAERMQRVGSLMDKTGISRELINRYPHEFSGGQCQRVGIARALIIEPKILVCDEPVSALDVSIQAQILNLLKDLQHERDLAMLFISHDLAVVRQISHRVMVMYLGKIMEQSHADALFNSPQHPYTQALLSAIPMINPQDRKVRIELEGELPDPLTPPSGCVFRTRCPLVHGVCAQEKPSLRKTPVGGFAACHFTASASDDPKVSRFSGRIA